MAELDSLFSLKGKVVLLTGASAGIGYRFAEVLTGAGAQIAVVARRADVLDELAERLGCLAVPADLADPKEVAAIVPRVVAELGPVDVLVNNAAFIAAGVKAESESLDVIRRTVDINLVAPILLAQAVFPSMRKRGGGSIINISSIAARVGVGRFPEATYAATKGALEAITREWAAQWSRFGLRVNALAPGFTETEITQDVVHKPNIQEWILRNTLLPRHAQPNDFDGALLFLASDASAYVTGQTIVVDGGWTAH